MKHVFFNVCSILKRNVQTINHLQQEVIVVFVAHCELLKIVSTDTLKLSFYVRSLKVNAEVVAGDCSMPKTYFPKSDLTLFDRKRKLFNSI